MQRPRDFNGPQNLGQLWELSEDAQEIWEAYDELADYVGWLEDTHHRDMELLSENEMFLSDAMSEVRELVRNIDHTRVAEIRRRLKEIVSSTMADY